MPQRCLLFAFLALAIPSAAQLVTAPLARPSSTNGTTARTKAEELTLPFWDDFSFTPGSTPQDSLWSNSASVLINDGLGINPPSIRVATFDGTDASGTPYNINDVLAKGYADNLESQFIRMDEVDPSLRPSVSLSFFYQMTGRGETPDLGDLLLLQFKAADNTWETVWSAENDGTLDPTKFYRVVLPIAEKYFHNTFQFRLQNFARLSGPYDTWHVDYIYLSNGVISNDPPNFPDRTIITPISSLLGNYFSIPYKHFLADLGTVLAKPRLTIANQRADQVIGDDGKPNGQPINYNSMAALKSYVGTETSTTLITLDSAQQAGDALLYGVNSNVVLNKIPTFDMFNASADSAEVELFLKFNTGDNEIKVDTAGDYRPEVYAPIDFRSNDTTRSTFRLSSFYAYDDATAEYGAGLNQPGAMVAYEFNLVGVAFDSIVALDLYFPRFGDEASRVIELRIWSALTDDPSDVIYREVVTVQRNSQNQFWRKKLIEPRRLPARFYIGWKQSTAAVIAMGLDKNTDSGSKIYYNISGTWEQNTQIVGSLMMRPVFGKGKKGVDNGLEHESLFYAYPNPSTGTFYFSGLAEKVSVYDLTGRPAGFEQVAEGDQTQIRLLHPHAGLYLLKVEQQGIVKTAKLLVRP